MSVFFSTRKTVFEKLAQHLLDSWLSVELPKAFSYHNLNSWWIDRESFWPLDISSTPGGSIEHHSCLWCFSSSTASRHFVYRRCIFLDTCLTDGSTPPRHLICQDLLMVFNTPRAIRSSLLSISLSFFQTFHLPNLPYSLQTSSLGILKLSSSLSSLGKLLISFIYMHFMFWNLRFRVFDNFCGFSKLMKYCWNFGLVFKDLFLKTSCIALHLHYNNIIMHLDLCILFVCWWDWIGLSPWCIYFACHMFMHYPCICTSFHIFLLLWTVLELFWLFLSFPSLSFGYISSVYGT